MSPGELLITFSTSEVAVCCSSASASCLRASASSRACSSGCFCKSAEDGGRWLVSRLLVLRRRALPPLPPAVARRFMKAFRASGGKDSTAQLRQDLLHCGIAVRPMSARGHSGHFHHPSVSASLRMRTNSRRLDLSALCRLCCKSRKLQSDEFFAKTRNEVQSLIRI